MSTINFHLDNKIRKKREKRGWTQKQLAEMSGVPYRTLLKIELGQSKEPTIQTVFKLSKALNISINNLLK